MHKFLKLALKKAREYDYDPSLDYRHCAVLVKGGKVLSIGYNQRSTNSFVERYTDFVKGFDRDFNISTHAEMDCVAQTRQKTDLRGSKIYVARILKNNDPALSRPCCICQKVLYSYGIKRSLYTISECEYGVLNIRPEGSGGFMCHDNLINTGSL